MAEEPKSIKPPGFPFPQKEEFDHAQLLMIQEIFMKTNFPGQACGAIYRFLGRCERMIQQAENYDPGCVVPMNTKEEKGKA